MKRLGLALFGIALAITPALAQQAQQQASAPAAGAFDDMLAALHEAPRIGAHIDALGAVPEHKVELRDAYQIQQNSGRGDQLNQALNDNPQAIQQLRQSLIKNRAVDRALARDQVPITNVVAANVEPGGRVVVYAFPQGVTPPR